MLAPVKANSFPPDARAQQGKVAEANLPALPSDDASHIPTHCVA